MPRIYLSPSTQEYNQYVTGGNEEYYMNLIADAMIPYLQASGIEYTRNNPAGTVTDSIAESNAGRYGMHVALHSNAAPESMSGQLQGVDVYYRLSSPESARFAQIVADNFKEIYPNPNRVNARPSQNLAEVLRTRAPAVLIEVAYHDNPNDANWIINNIQEIARTIVLSLTEYFGIPFAEPQPTRLGTVRTGGPNLNVRSMPTVNSTIVAIIPNGGKVTIFSRTGDWYVIRYKNATGYVTTKYVEVQQ